jgi:L-alanine-DL-glutamate epimerase-like enolase superfamily enzyme
MHLLRAIPNAGPYLELSIEGADYYPWQVGIFTRDPYTVENGRVTVTDEPGWGTEPSPAWLERAQRERSEITS